VPGQLTAFGPGRVNLIGEHTDYNQGLALPLAIEAGVTVRARVVDGREVEAVALDLDEVDRFPVGEPGRGEGWRAFVRGAVGELQRAGVSLPGAHLEFSGTVPRGSGLSSSAALEVALVLALLGLAGEPEPPRIELAQLCSRIENDWVGAQTGMLDQLAALCGQTGHALRIDFRTLEVRPVPLDLEGHRLVTLDSGEQHANARGGYNRRRAECARACELLGVESLREAVPEMARDLPDPLDRRVAHVLGAEERVDEAVRALAERDLPRLGKLIDQEHASLRDLYEVSTNAVEETVQSLREAGAIGARIVGGGFGGHVLGLLPPDATPPSGAVEVTPGPGARLL